jgi:hypothetical protein
LIKAHKRRRILVLDTGGNFMQQCYFFILGNIMAGVQYRRNFFYFL